YYAMTQLLGLRLPVATVFYVTVMPALGFILGRWRYQADGARGAGAWIAKAAARGFHFLYAHLLIVLFTLAMAVNYFFGWNMDSAVEEIDDNLFDIASRFAPWLAAYLAGFNLGRVWAAGAAEVNRMTRAAEQGDVSLSERPEPVLSADGFTDRRDNDRHDDVVVSAPLTPPPTDLDPNTRKPRFSRLR
ncbi:MAG: hypothetical protein AAGJ87_17005, partial [Pseudomonadota bacterium]